MAATVLVVEDERKLRDFIRSYLERAGFTVLSTGSGAEAITMAAEAAPDLVVLDLGLPDVPGRDGRPRAPRGGYQGGHGSGDADPLPHREKR
jgi:DNA-binding response OmpR family regulator